MKKVITQDFAWTLLLLSCLTRIWWIICISCMIGIAINLYLVSKEGKKGKFRYWGAVVFFIVVLTANIFVSLVK